MSAPNTTDHPAKRHGAASSVGQEVAPDLADDVVEESGRQRRSRIATLFNTFFFLFAGFASLWLVVVAALDTRRDRWIIILYVIVLWAILAYVFLPRFYRLMTAIFVPDYFIGRARTSDGLLGDIINLAWNGTDINIHRVMQDAGWVLSQPVTLKSSLGIIGSVLLRKPYPQAPVSPLYLFGKMQDFAYQQEVGASANQRHHIRFWKCPKDWPLPGGQTVGWLAAASFDTGVRLSMFTLQVTHATSGDVDEERDYTISSVKKVDPDLQVAWIEKFSTAFHARNGGGDLVHTDGNLPIVNVGTLPPSIPELSAKETEAIRVVDPAPPKTYAQKLRQTPRPFGLFLTLAFVLLAVAGMIVAAYTGHTESLALSWMVVGVILVASTALFFGLTWGRWLLLGTYGAVVIAQMVNWFQAHMRVTSHYEVATIAVTTVLVVLLSSEGVTLFAESITEWLRERRRQHRRRRRETRHNHTAEKKTVR